MVKPLRQRDLLLDYFNNPTHSAWSRDLVAKIIKSNGYLSSSEIEVIIDEIKNKEETISEDLSDYQNSPFKKIEINSITHVSGINALAENQTITFCNEGHTIIYGANGSGKSGYFRILNQLSKGSQSYKLNQNIYKTTPQVQNIQLSYTADGIKKEFAWNCKENPPEDLRHIRLFDSNYADYYLKVRNNNEYIFKSYRINLFQSLAKIINSLNKNNLISNEEYDKIKSLYEESYCQTLIENLNNNFVEELNNFGMSYIKVNLSIENLLESDSEIKVTILNKYEPTTILSEAEKKCVALSLFLAEFETFEIPQPLIFDDPVNSLDAYIMEAFTERVSKIKSQVIIFTHNLLLLTLLLNKNGTTYKLYPNASKPRETKRTPLLVYDIIANSPHEPGFIINHLEAKSTYYISKAEEYLQSHPILRPTETEELTDILRHAVEYMVDEVIFYNQQPLKYRGKENIPWKDLKNMINLNINNVDKLSDIYKQLSNTGTHLGQGSTFYPKSRSNLENIKNELKNIYLSVHPI